MLRSLHIGAVLSQGAHPIVNVPTGSTREPDRPTAKPFDHEAEESLARPTDMSAQSLFADTGIATVPPAIHNVRRNSERPVHGEFIVDEFDEIDFIPWEDEVMPAWLEPPTPEVYTLTGLELN